MVLSPTQSVLAAALALAGPTAWYAAPRTVEQGPSSILDLVGVWITSSAGLPQLLGGSFVGGVLVGLFLAYRLELFPRRERPVQVAIAQQLQVARYEPDNGARRANAAPRLRAPRRDDRELEDTRPW